MFHETMADKYEKLSRETARLVTDAKGEASKVQSQAKQTEEKDDKKGGKERGQRVKVGRLLYCLGAVPACVFSSACTAACCWY